MIKTNQTKERGLINTVKHLLDPNKRYAAIFGEKGKEIPEGIILYVSEDGSTIIDVKKKKVLYQNDYVPKHLPKSNDTTRDLYKYVYVEYPNGLKRKQLVHRLVACAWIGWPPEGVATFIANHKDGNKQNNNASNLEWVTKGANNRHAIAYRERGDVRGNRYWIYDIDEDSFSEVGAIRQVAARTGLRYEYVNKYLDCPIKTQNGRFVIFDHTGRPAGCEDEDYDPSLEKWDVFFDVNKYLDTNLRNVKATNVETKEVRFFRTKKEMVDALNLPFASVSQAINNPSLNHRAINGWFVEEVVDQFAPRRWLEDQGVLVRKKKTTNEQKRKPIRVRERDTGKVMDFDWFGPFVEYASKKHGKQYDIKNTQRVVLVKARLGGKKFWKEFDIDYLEDLVQ